VGLAATLGAETLASTARDRGRRRSRLRFLEAPRALPQAEKADHLRHPRLRLDAALYEPAPARRPGQRGRPRLKGERLPNLSEVAEDPNTVWKPTTIANWYGSGDRMVEVSSRTAVWYSTGLFAVPVRWVLVRDPKGEFKTQALLCTDLEAAPQQIVCWFVMRWQLEEYRTHYPHKPRDAHLHAA
jgi:hypothetical protein